MHKLTCDLGETYESDKIKIFFGRKNSAQKSIDEAIQFGHQVHGSNLIKVKAKPAHSNHFLKNSDGLWTDLPMVKIGVYTADCIPCFIHSGHKIFSLHLGWRGLVSPLLQNCLKLLNSNDDVSVFIGPHISMDSFEVGEEVFTVFNNVDKLSNRTDWMLKKDNGKYNISLEKVLRLLLPEESLTFSSKIDTFQSNLHHSYRRDDQTRERNISFAFLK